MNARPLTSPTSTRMHRPVPITCAASPASRGIPRSLAKCFIVPTGITPSAVSVPRSTSATALSVPSPPAATRTGGRASSARRTTSLTSSPRPNGQSLGSRPAPPKAPPPQARRPPLERPPHDLPPLLARPEWPEPRLEPRLTKGLFQPLGLLVPMPVPRPSVQDDGDLLQAQRLRRGRVHARADVQNPYRRATHRSWPRALLLQALQAI